MLRISSAHSSSRQQKISPNISPVSPAATSRFVSWFFSISSVRRMNSSNAITCLGYRFAIRA